MSLAGYDTHLHLLLQLVLFLGMASVISIFASGAVVSPTADLSQLFCRILTLVVMKRRRGNKAGGDLTGYSKIFTLNVVAAAKIEIICNIKAKISLIPP